MYDNRYELSKMITLRYEIREVKMMKGTNVSSQNEVKMTVHLRYNSGKTAVNRNQRETW